MLLKTIRKIGLFIIVISNVLVSPVVSAGQVTGSAVGIFEDPAGPAGMVVTGVGTSHFTWGLRNILSKSDVKES